MPLYTLKICIAKLEQGENGAPDKPQHSVSIQSNNLTLDETKEMQTELLPVLSNFLKTDTE